MGSSLRSSTNDAQAAHGAAGASTGECFKLRPPRAGTGAGEGAGAVAVAEAAAAAAAADDSGR